MCIFIHAFVINWAEDAAEQAQSKQAEDILGEESGTPFSIRDKKTSFGERSGADSNNSSSKGLQQGGSERLSSRPHTHQVDAAKVAANTIKTKRSAQKLINAGGFESGLQIGDAIRNVGNVLKLDKSKSSFSYYGDFEGDFDVNGKIIHLRVSSHPANGQRMGDADADIKVSLVIKKGDGEHKDAGEHNGYTEYVYDPSEVSPSDAANAIVKGVLNLIEKGEFVDETGKAKKIDYPYVGEDGETKFRITDEERRIIDKAKADGTYMKAPNGRPTNLNEKQWAQVRTAAFKNWFGDWEKAARVEKLRTSRPVEVVFRNEYELNRESAKQWIKDNLRGEYVNEDTGENISLSKVGANKVTSHGERDEAHLKSIVSIPSLIRSSIFIEELPNEKGNDKYDSYRYYVCGMKIDGEDYTAKIVVGVKGDSKYYDHRLTQIEKGTLIDNLNGLANSVAENQNAPTSVGKDTKLVSLLQTNSSKIVDENGEPMVAYHSGASGITAFSREFDKQGIGRQFWGKGFYFGTEKSKNEWSRRYKGKTGKEAEEYPVFLNIRSPHYGPIKGEITESGYDGSILPPVRTHEGETEPIFIVGGSNQIKSATENVGTFDAGDNDIRFRRTYHGSGNSFERFDHRHMGEGEGAQAYGWGTYVTDVEGIARTYASSSSLFNKVFSDDNDYEAARSVGSVGLAEIAIRSYMEEMNLNFADAKAKALSDAKEIVEEDGELGETTQDKIFKGMIEALPGVTEQMVEDMAKYRHLYEVEIPDNNGMNYLPYDKPISDEMRKYLEDEFDVPGLADAVTGREVYDAFSRHYGGDKVASKMFDIVGIVGVEYPADYRSGGRGEGVNNYVIFNEENAKIVDHTMFRLSKNERAWVRENDVTPDSFRLLADVGIVSRGEAPQWIDPTLKEVYLENKAAFDAMASEVAEEETMFQISSSNKSARRYDKENGTNVEGFFKYLRNGKVAKKGEPDQFHIANAGPILEKYGIKGKFIVGSFTFSRSHTDNEDHKLGVKEWVDVINNLNTPLAITSYKGKPNEYRIYTYATINGKNICVGVNVSTKDGEIYLSNIISAYGRDVEKLLRQEMVYLIYPSEKELKQRILQVSTAHNSLLNASPTASFESKGSAKGSDLQDEANGSSDMNAKNMGESDVLQSSDSKSDEETMMRIKGNGGEEGMYRDEDGNLMFSIRNRATRQVRQIPGGVAVTYYNNELRRGGSSMLEGHYDRYRSLRILQEGVAKETGKKIEDFENQMGRQKKALNYLYLSAPIAEASDRSRLEPAAKIVEEFENPTFENGDVLTDEKYALPDNVLQSEDSKSDHEFRDKRMIIK